MKKIYIDPGHGGDSIGATYKGRLEQDDTLRLAKKVRECLKPYDVEVKLAREGNTNPSLNARAAEANAWGAGYFLSLHRNAIGPNIAKGVENWVYSKVSKTGETYKQAARILNLVCTRTGFSNRGMKLGAPSYADFAVNRLTNMSSCLLEVGFIDSDTDNRIFDSKFNEMAQAIAEGLAEAVGAVKGTTEETPEVIPEEEAEGVIYTVQAAAFIKKNNAEAFLKAVQAAGFGDAFISIKGDVDGDGRLTAADAHEILRKSTGLEG